MNHTTRFAPSPTGYLHLGHAFSALFSRARGERFLLRLEDIDQGRCRAEYAAAIAEDLAWLGIAWDGPTTFLPDQPIQRPVPIKGNDWLVIDVAKQPNEMHCTRCGERHPMPTKSTAKMIEAMLKT